jgi:hypothetical protein
MLEGAITKAVKVLLDAQLSNSAFRQALGQRYYFGLAPSDAVEPYAVFTVIGVGPQYFKGSVVEEYEVQFNIYQVSASAGGVTAAGAALCGVLDDTASLVVTGYTVSIFERKTSICFEPKTQDTDIPEQQYTVLYRVILTKP